MSYDHSSLPVWNLKLIDGSCIYCLEHLGRNNPYMWITDTKKKK